MYYLNGPFLAVKIYVLVKSIDVKFVSSPTFKLSCEERFTHAFIACGCNFKDTTLVDSNKGNYFGNVTA
jgi:hypothetical protein